MKHIDKVNTLLTSLNVTNIDADHLKFIKKRGKATLPMLSENPMRIEPINFSLGKEAYQIKLARKFATLTKVVAKEPEVPFEERVNLVYEKSVVSELGITEFNNLHPGEYLSVVSRLFNRYVSHGTVDPICWRSLLAISNGLTSTFEYIRCVKSPLHTGVYKLGNTCELVLCGKPSVIVNPITDYHRRYALLWNHITPPELTGDCTELDGTWCLVFKDDDEEVRFTRFLWSIIIAFPNLFVESLLEFAFNGDESQQRRLADMGLGAKASSYLPQDEFKDPHDDAIQYSVYARGASDHINVIYNSPLAVWNADAELLNDREIYEHESVLFQPKEEGLNVNPIEDLPYECLINLGQEHYEELCENKQYGAAFKAFYAENIRSLINYPRHQNPLIWERAFTTSKGVWVISNYTGLKIEFFAK